MQSRAASVVAFYGGPPIRPEDQLDGLSDILLEAQPQATWEAHARAQEPPAVSVHPRAAYATAARRAGAAAGAAVGGPLGCMLGSKSGALVAAAGVAAGAYSGPRVAQRLGATQRELQLREVEPAQEELPVRCAVCASEQQQQAAAASADSL